MSEQAKPDLRFYGIVAGQKPILAIGVETKASVTKRGNDYMAEQLDELHSLAHLNMTFEVRRPPDRYGVALGLAGLVIPLFQV